MLQKDIERFEIFGIDGKWLIKDNKQLPSLLDCYQSCARLNQQSQRIAELEEQLKNATKQVRKEVLGDLMNMLGDRAELIDCGGVAEFMFTTYDLSMCVKEILGEEVKENEDA